MWSATSVETSTFEVLRYESSNPPSQELSSLLSFKICLWGIGVTWPNFHFFSIYKGIHALYWPISAIKNEPVPPFTDSIPPSTKQCCPLQLSQLDLVKGFLSYHWFYFEIDPKVRICRKDQIKHFFLHLYFETLELCCIRKIKCEDHAAASKVNYGDGTNFDKELWKFSSAEYELFEKAKLREECMDFL